MASRKDNPNKEPRQLKELRSLMPWTWDSNRDKHPPGAWRKRRESVVSAAWSIGEGARPLLPPACPPSAPRSARVWHVDVFQAKPGRITGPGR